MPDFKYAEHLLGLSQTGITCPPIGELAVIDSKLAYRYVFEDINHTSNHKPAGVIKPQRVLDAKPIHKCAHYSLSCFEEKEGALGRFEELKAFNKNIKKSLGDCLCRGILDVKDGMTSDAAYLTHFELFEYTTCDLSTKFVIIQKLP